LFLNYWTSQGKKIFSCNRPTGPAKARKYSLVPDLLGQPIKARQYSLCPDLLHQPEKENILFAQTYYTSQGKKIFSLPRPTTPASERKYSLVPDLLVLLQQENILYLTDETSYERKPFRIHS
jgi:hypothetical protein